MPLQPSYARIISNLGSMMRKIKGNDDCNFKMLAQLMIEIGKKGLLIFDHEHLKISAFTVL